jgi:predicted nucleic acid-binding protein
VIVVDASIVVVALVDRGPDGSLARARLAHGPAAAPSLLDVEVVSVLRKHTRAGRLDERGALDAVRDLHDLPVRRVHHQALLERMWRLRDNLTAYDATYVALAELLDAPLVTADAKLSRSPGVACKVELLSLP